ncbi:hypothetical protein HW132_34760, partial [Brasilonema sp. CT11]|nr:hypothetical protein [Brasilonema sp. CT11]
KKQKEFKELLLEAIETVYSAGIAELTKGSIEAARELRRIALDSETGDRIKVSAIVAMFSQIEKFQSWQLEERLAKLETKLDGTNTEQD